MEVLKSLAEKFDGTPKPNNSELISVARYIENKVLLDAALKQHSSEYIDFVELIETALVDTEEWLGAVFKLSASLPEGASSSIVPPPHRETSLGLIAVDWNYEQHTTCYSANRRDYFLHISASFAKAVEWYFDRYRLLKVQQNDLMEFGLYGWYVHTLETLMDIISPRNKEAKKFQLTIVEELSKLYEDHFMWDDHKRIRKQYYEYSCEKDIFLSLIHI